MKPGPGEITINKGNQFTMVTEASYTYVAIDQEGQKRTFPKSESLFYPGVSKQAESGWHFFSFSIMLPPMRNFIVCIYFVKAAELNVIRETAIKLLRGLNFAAAYTPHFAMCTDNLSEIMLATDAEVVETRSVMRFSCSGLLPKAEMKKIRGQLDACFSQSPETVGFWYKNEPDYFEKAAAKANQALQKTLKEIGGKSGSSFNVMIVNNDTLPMLELLASKDFNNLEIARPGNVTQFRYEVVIGPRNIMNWRLVHAYSFK